MQAQIDLGSPRRGLSDLRLAEETVEGMRLLGVEFPGDKADTCTERVEEYCRGADLVATYAENDQRNVRCHLQWRAIDDSEQGVTAMTLQVSAQTSELAVRPEIATRTELPLCESLMLSGQSFVPCNPEEPSRRPVQVLPDSTTGGAFVFRPSGASWSYVEMVHPAGWSGTRLIQQDAPNPSLLLTHRLFDTELEKGVIMRARVRGIFVPRQADLDNARAAFAVFDAEPPPLTT